MDSKQIEQTLREGGSCTTYFDDGHLDTEPDKSGYSLTLTLAFTCTCGDGPGSTTKKVAWGNNVQAAAEYHEKIMRVLTRGAAREFEYKKDELQEMCWMNYEEYDEYLIKEDRNYVKFLKNKMEEKKKELQEQATEIEELERDIRERESQSEEED
jgi:hypothetical protein